MATYGQDTWSIPRERAGLSVTQRYMARVYGYMTLGLFISAASAFATITVPALRALVFTPFGVGALMVATLVMVFAYSALAHRVATGTAALMLLSYAVLNGMMLSGVFLAYTATSIVGTLVVTAGMFGAMSAWGMVARRDLTSWGSFGMMGVIGIILASLVNIFLQNNAMAFIISVVGVIAFVALTAYDTQRILRAHEASLIGSRGNVERSALSGALTLYLDFINLFLMLLRLGGHREE
ncbi:MAG: Bax inhibitor-1/YccA family protein [Myxococcota bacterium]